MKLDTFLEGLEILQPHYSDPNGYHLGAEHDVIYAYPTDIPLSVASVTKMCELGWHQEDVATGDDGFKPEHYDPSEGWAYYV